MGYAELKKVGAGEGGDRLVKEGTARGSCRWRPGRRRPEWAGAAGVGEEGMVREVGRQRPWQLEGQEDMGYCLVFLAWVTGGHGTITR